jgi:hypothetical protein
MAPIGTMWAQTTAQKSCFGVRIGPSCPGVVRRLRMLVSDWHGGAMLVGFRGVSHQVLGAKSRSERALAGFAWPAARNPKL